MIDYSKKAEFYCDLSKQESRFKAEAWLDQFEIAHESVFVEYCSDTRKLSDAERAFYLDHNLDIEEEEYLIGAEVVWFGGPALPFDEALKAFEDHLQSLGLELEVVLEELEDDDDAL